MISLFGTTWALSPKRQKIARQKAKAKLQDQTAATTTVRQHRSGISAGARGADVARGAGCWVWEPERGTRLGAPRALQARPDGRDDRLYRAAAAWCRWPDCCSILWRGASLDSPIT